MNKNRRQFLAETTKLGTGLTLGFQIPVTVLSSLGSHKVFASEHKFVSDACELQSPSSEIDAWVCIQSDDTCVIRIARTEMGQGTLTGLAQLVADELDADWSKVVPERVSPQANLARNKIWGQMLTVGSFGIRFSQDYVRRGGAAARFMLLSAAAKTWQVPFNELSVSQGIVTHAPSNRRTTYGQLAGAAALLTPPDPKSLVLKTPKEWKLIGQPLKRIDTFDKLNGQKKYGIDVNLPGMLCAAVVACPVFGGKLLSLNDSNALKMPGVKKVVKVGDDAFAVVANTWWRAKTALDAVNVQWDLGIHQNASDASILNHLKEGLQTNTGLYEFRNEGDAITSIAGAVKKVEGTYFAPFLAHATMEPMNCTAKVDADRAEVWAPTQDPEGSMLAMSKTSGLPLEKCYLNRFDPGGGFGRRGRVSDYVVQAVQIAMQIPGVPIKMIWSREEDMTHGQYRPISMCKFTAGLDEQNKVVGMHVRLSGQSIYAWRNPSANLTGYKDDFQLQGWFKDTQSDQQLCYTLPNLLIQYAMRNTHVPVGTWRGVNVPQNSFYMECFIEELARAANMDSIEFRRSLMPSQARQLAILNLAAEKSEWHKPSPKGVFKGVAQFMSYGTYCASVVELSLNQRGEVKVHKIVLALDCGYAVNPNQIEAQVQGSIVYGLSAAFWGECTVDNGRIVQTNFDNYRVLRLAEMPKVETYIQPALTGPWGGIGEPTIGVVAPAVVNAISLAIGRPIRSLPLKNETLKQA